MRTCGVVVYDDIWDTTDKGVVVYYDIWDTTDMWCSGLLMTYGTLRSCGVVVCDDIWLWTRV